MNIDKRRKYLNMSIKVSVKVERHRYQCILDEIIPYPSLNKNQTDITLPAKRQLALKIKIKINQKITLFFQTISVKLCQEVMTSALF